LFVSRFGFSRVVAEMPKMMLSPDRLAARLEPQGFRLRDTQAVTNLIAFVRPSIIPRLYEHLNVHGQGKVGEAVYATTAVSGSTNHSCDECVSEEDLTLLYTLETDKDRHWTLVLNKQDAEIWEERLSRVADSQCRATAKSMGPSLRERLQPAFSAVDRYITKLGNLNDVFASEFRYFQEAPAGQRSEAERFASLIGNIGESSEDVQLACLVVFLFATDVEGRADAFRGKKWHEDANLRVRIYLLVDFIRKQRRRGSG
jgi:hypothetical protein